MKDLNYWLEIKESIKHYLLWAINILMEGSILILWLFTQWFVNLLISLLNVNGIESNILLIFRIIFALSLIVQVIIMSYHNMRILLIKSHDTINEEHNKDILINHLKIEKKELIKNKLTSTFQKFLPRLGAYITSILIGISILSLYVFLSKNKSYVNINALFYLILPEFLIFYSIVTTKILNKSLKYLALQSVKRLFDILFSSLCLIYMLPIIGLISILIKLDSHGPIFYRSKRIGQFGVPFDCYKFRTIYTK